MDTASPATWESRFWAWLIDILLVGLIYSMFGDCLDIPGTLDVAESLGIVWALGITEGLGIDALGIGLAAFVYWTVLEGYRGQSIGKMVMNIAVVDASGKMIGYEKAAIECFGKAFLLPLDCLIGWQALPASCQRLFNGVSDTLVVRTDIEVIKSLQTEQILSRTS